MGLLDKLFGGSPEEPASDMEMPNQIIGLEGSGQAILDYGTEEYQPPAGYSTEEAEQVAASYKQRKGVADARPVTFLGTTHVHIDYYAANGTLGDIGVVNPDGEQRIEMAAPAEEERPWWKLW
jgi:hypothetical protein